MAGWKDLVLDIIKLTDTVKILNDRTEKLSAQTYEIDKRVVRIETLVEIAQYNKIPDGKTE